MEKQILQWHPTFQAILQIEFGEEAQYLQFLKEYNLTEKPLQMDTLIIKAVSGRKIRKKIGAFFRQYNIVEYKSPTDYISINDFYKVTGYACVYQSNTRQILEISPEDMTITLVGNHYPGKMLNYLKKVHKAETTEMFPGIYYVTGLLFPMQILVIGRLDKGENIWLSRLREDLELHGDIEPLMAEYRKEKQNPLYEAAMDLIIRANWKNSEEGKMMCNALRELFADELEEREHRGIEKGIEKGIERGREAGKAEAVLELLEETGPVPEQLSASILSQTDMKTLTKWLRLAAKAESAEAFREAAGL